MRGRTKVERKKKATAEVSPATFASSFEDLDSSKQPALPTVGHSFSNLSTLRPQAKLSVSQPGDQYEREADRVADQVMRMEKSDDEIESTIPQIARKEQNDIQSADDVTPIAQAGLQSDGQPLDAETRAFMEPRFGHDFSQVRLHSGADATQSARDMNAKAYTVGNHIVFDSGQFATETPEGRHLIAHELTHVVQQSASEGIGLGQNRGKVENSIVTGLLQRQGAATPSAGAPTPSQPVGAAVQPEVENLLKTFATASDYVTQNAAAMQAVRAIIRAYNMSTQGLKTMRFKPDLNPKHNAETGQVEGHDRESEIEFGPSAFSQGFPLLVHIVAHELEHVRQNLIGGYHRGDEVEAVSEFLAYTAMVLQVQNVPGPAGRGLIGALKTGDAQSAPTLPPLPPSQLADRADLALSMFSRMPSADQKKPQYRQELAAAGNKLFERLKNEAPAPLRPPVKFTPEWSRWYEGLAPTLDILTPDYQDWQDSLKSPWIQVKEIWKKFDMAFRVK